MRLGWVFAGAALLVDWSDFQIVADLAGPGDLETAVRPRAGQAHAGEAGEATAILQAGWAARRLAQHEPVKG